MLLWNQILQITILNAAILLLQTFNASKDGKRKVGFVVSG